MIFFKLYYHFAAIVKKIIFSIVYPGRIAFGKHTTFRLRFHVAITGDGRLSIGNSCFFNHDCSISCRKRISIGDGSIFGENVKMYDHNHNFSKNVSVKSLGYSDGEIHIGRNCWVGSNVVFLKGAEVGDHCVIGAGCIIDCAVPSDTIVTMNRQISLQAIEKA